MDILPPAKAPISSIQLELRKQSAAKHTAIEIADVRLVALLPVYSVGSWFVPERSWHDLIRRRFTSIDKKGPLATISRGIVASGLEDRLVAEGDTIARELNANRLESYLQYLRDYRPSRWKIDFTIQCENVLRRQLELGSGAILWVGHFVFNGLPLKKALYQAGYKVFHLSRPEHGFSSSRFGMQILNPIRSRIEDRYLAKRIIIKRSVEHRAMREAHRLLSQGEIVSITAGHWEGRRVALAPIGNAVLPLSVGAPSLAHATGAPLLPTFIVRDRANDGSTFRVVLGQPIGIDGSQRRDQAVRSAVADFTHQLMPLIISHPDQWRGWKYLRAASA